MGQPENAALYFTSYFDFATPWTRSLYYLGLAYEDMGEVEKALEAWAEYLDILKNADPELQPMVEEARQAITRLQNR